MRWTDPSQRAAFTRAVAYSGVGWAPLADELGATPLVNAFIQGGATQYTYAQKFVSIIEGNGCPEAAVVAALKVVNMSELITTENGFSISPNGSLASTESVPTKAAATIVLALGSSRTVDALDITLEFNKAYDAIILALFKQKSMTSPWARESAFCMHHSVSDQNMRQFIQAFRPVVVHISAHANEKTIQFVHDGASERVTDDQLAAFFKGLNPRANGLKLLVLNGCNTWKIAERLCNADEASLPYAIGVDGDLPDAAAQDWSKQFYQALALGSTIKIAFGVAVSYFVGRVYKKGESAAVFKYHLFSENNASSSTVP